MNLLTMVLSLQGRMDDVASVVNQNGQMAVSCIQALQIELAAQRYIMADLVAGRVRMVGTDLDFAFYLEQAVKILNAGRLTDPAPPTVPPTPEP